MTAKELLNFLEYLRGEGENLEEINVRALEEYEEVVRVAHDVEFDGESVIVS